MTSLPAQFLRTWRVSTALALLLGVAALGGCSFDEATKEDAPPNSCIVRADCPDGLNCQAGICVMSQVDAPLDVTLEITPKRMPDGSQPFPILYGPFALSGGRRNFELPAPVAITGSVTAGAEVLNAQLTFIPVDAPPSLAKPIQARSGLSTLRSAFSVQLLAGVKYRVTVQPTEAEIPPYTQVFTAEKGLVLDIDYEEIGTSTLSFVVRGAPSQSLTIRARAKDSNQIISNVEPLGEGRATLKFAGPTPPPFRVELVHDQSITSQLLMLFGSCDAEGPLVPTFTIEDTAFKREASARMQNAFDLAVDLPTLPEPVRYEGRIGLCTKLRALEGLPVSLRSTALALPNLPQGISASFNVTADAVRDADDSQLFCSRVLPGEYVVLVTPPAALNCEIFAEKRQILASSTGPDALGLRTPTRLNGKILDSNMMPIPNATIDAIALGIDTTAMLAENDLTVPIYNRSRQTSTDAGGSFALYVDVGVYDLIVKPPSQTGFAWQIQPGVTVGGARLDDFTTRVEVGAPALIEGSLRYAGAGAGAQSSLAGAEVHAYTVEDEKGPNARGVEIGHTQADEDGNVMLLISPEPQPSW